MVLVCLLLFYGIEQGTATVSGKRDGCCWLVVCRVSCVVCVWHGACSPPSATREAEEEEEPRRLGRSEVLDHSLLSRRQSSAIGEESLYLHISTKLGGRAMPWVDFFAHWMDGRAISLAL
jgi:hypothetical protein